MVSLRHTTVAQTRNLRSAGTDFKRKRLANDASTRSKTAIRKSRATKLSLSPARKTTRAVAHRSVSRERRSRGKNNMASPRIQPLTIAVNLPNSMDIPDTPSYRRPPEMPFRNPQEGRQDLVIRSRLDSPSCPPQRPAAAVKKKTASRPEGSKNRSTLLILIVRFAKIYSKDFAGTSEPLKACSECDAKFHLRSCLKYNDILARKIEKKYSWSCAKCVRCQKCAQFIADPSNVECWECALAWHGACKPTKGHTQGTHFGAPWYCSSCTQKLGLSPQKKPAKRPRKSTPKVKSPTESGKRRSRSKKERSVTPSWEDAETEELMELRYKLYDELVDAAGLGSPAKTSPPKSLKRSLSPQKRPLGASATKVARAPANDHLSSPGPSSSSSSATPQRSQGTPDSRFRSPHNPKSSSSSAIRQLFPRESARQPLRIAIEHDRQLFEAALRDYENRVEVEPVRNNFETPSTEQWVFLGRGEAMKALCASAYGGKLQTSSEIHVCMFCLHATHDRTLAEIHWDNCDWRYPPGNEIYRDGNLSFFEVDGAKENWYCRNLCLLAKLFISSKTLHHEVDTFLFYVLCEITNEGLVIVGYFSKEKNPSKNNNLSCLLTLPNVQRMGYGRLLIDMSYALSRLERKIGSPEHPLSDLGLLAYRGYWRSSILCFLRSMRDQHRSVVSIKEMSLQTRINPIDIVNQLMKDKMLQSRRDSYYIKTGKRGYKYALSQMRRKTVNLEKLQWEPNPQEIAQLDPHKINFYV
ncbi:unnamed protein product [Caenorhabditis auriculariae]|uniref:Histone acetyltransferase n=1 Tax=Caenorhabditis auriculariae TaxID=2777116 RepID=A0A8S1H310_9PELO|nr:unnamed protein product [Caenorhabditis auriculariae]